MVNTCAAKSAWNPGKHTKPGFFGGWADGRGVKTSRRDRDRVCAKFEMPRRFRASNLNQKKRPAEPEASAAIQASI
jgi:hypothetical protein